MVDKSIYDHNRLIRMRNSIHSGSDLYKVELPHEKVLSAPIDEIKEWAKEPRETDNPHEFIKNDHLADLWKEVQRRDISSYKKQSTHIIIHDFPKDKKACIHKMLNGVESGSRHNAAMRIANQYKKDALFQSDVNALLTSWASRCTPELDLGEVNKIVTDIFSNHYDYGCKDPFMRGYCDPKCKFNNPAVESDVRQLKDFEDDYRKLVSQSEESTIDLGNWLPTLGKYVRPIRPGSVVVITAATGVGKTTFLINLVKEVIK